MISLLSFFAQIALALPIEPIITFANGQIKAAPPKGIATQGQNIEILGKSGCEGRVESRSSVSIPTRCDYLHGLYRYVYVSGESRVRNQVITDFSITRKAPGSQSFLVGEAIQFDEKRFPTNPLN